MTAARWPRGDWAEGDSVRISVFGLGYVGTVSAACLAREHEIIGVDPNPVKVDLVNQAKSPIVEKGLDELIASAVGGRRLRATTSAREAVAATELSLVCVGTPSRANGSLDLKYLERVCREIGEALAGEASFHTVVIRSTVLPGTMRGVVIPILEAASGKKAGEGFGICSNPEFLREGTAVHDYDHPPKTVIGTADDVSADRLARLYEKLDAPMVVTDVATAEMVKYVDNVWHALKVDFANEIGNICKAVGLDGHRVMEIFCKDTKLNLSPYYLKPGFAFGGSCLPKDVRALNYRAKTLDLDLPVLGAILRSNDRQVERGIQMVMNGPGRRVGVLGFSFKAGTDDLRESPIVTLIEHLIGKGYDLRLYDRSVSLARLTGANKAYIEEHVPHLAGLIVDSLDDILRHADTIVVGNDDPEFAAALGKAKAEQLIVDLVRMSRNPSGGAYQGICW
jgi:GDP-mannose 6-dehydrogenase